MSSFLEELRWRGFLEAVAGDELEDHLASGRRTMYVGFDPTADSLHLGSLVPVSGIVQTVEVDLGTKVEEKQTVA